MRRKDRTVETEFHSMITAFLFVVDEQYRAWGDEVVVTSGSEPGTRHGFTSLHYAKPCCAVDIRTWDKFQGRGDVPASTIQMTVICNVRDVFCKKHRIPKNWIDIILEDNHIHIEFQPKRQDAI